MDRAPSCVECRRPIVAGSAYCNLCGAPQPEGEAVAAPPERRNGTRTALVVTGAVLLACLVFGVLVYLSLQQGLQTVERVVASVDRRHIFPTGSLEDTTKAEFRRRIGWTGSLVVVDGLVDFYSRAGGRPTRTEMQGNQETWEYDLRDGTLRLKVVVDASGRVVVMSLDDA